MYRVLDNGVERDATPEEVIEIEANIAAGSIPIIPPMVTRRQAKQALFLAGKLDLVEPAINTYLPSPQKELALIEWNESQEFQRNRPLVAALGPLLGMTSTDIDNLFIAASRL